MAREMKRSQQFCLLFLFPSYPPKQSTLEFINKDICTFGACSDQLSHISFFGAGKKVYCLNGNAYGSLILMWCSRDNYFSWTGMSLAKKVEHIQNSADLSAANSGWVFFSPSGHVARCNRNKPHWNWLRIRIIFWLVTDLQIIGQGRRIYWKTKVS